MWAKLHDHATSSPSPLGEIHTHIPTYIPTYIYIYIVFQPHFAFFFLIPPPSREG